MKIGNTVRTCNLTCFVVGLIEPSGSLRTLRLTLDNINIIILIGSYHICVYFHAISKWCVHLKVTIEIRLKAELFYQL